MNDAIAAMLKRYGPIRTHEDEKNALTDILQQITLLGLHRGGFFEEASFYGGTAVRLVYGLDRFSEDMDFCLTRANREFKLQPYLRPIADELERYGFTASLEEKRTGRDAAIESAFVKQGTCAGLLVIGRKGTSLPRGQLTKIRLEVDKCNPPGAVRAKKLLTLPTPFMVGTLTEDSLFAGKLHALIARAYLNRVKGRDYYDFLFHLARGTAVNRDYLEAKLRDSGHYTDPGRLSRTKLLQFLEKRFQTVDYDKAKTDVLPFLKPARVRDLDTWSAELFVAMAQKLTFSTLERLQ